MKDFIIKSLYADGKVFSILSFENFDSSLLKFLETKNLKTVYSENLYDEKIIIKPNFKILQSPQEFYLTIENIGKSELWKLTIYYQETQEKELKFFIKNLFKNYKNATTDN